jgi:mannose-6-phosphate isomerase-like protein (cupin superfamily)
MTIRLQQIAARLKQARESNDIPIEWAAEALGVTAEELDHYESGEEDIPVSFLYVAAKKYDVELGELLTGNEPRQKDYALVRKDEGIQVDRRKEYDYQSLCADFVQKKIEPLLVIVEPCHKNESPHFNAHPGQEFHYLLEGRLKVIIDKDELILNPGDSLMFNSEIRHGLQAMDNRSAKVLVVIV